MQRVLMNYFWKAIHKTRLFYHKLIVRSMNIYHLTLRGASACVNLSSLCHKYARQYSTVETS